MRLVDAIREGVEIVRLDREAVRRVAADPEAFSMGIIITAIMGLAAWLEPTTHRSWELFTAPIAALFWLFVSTAIFHFAALLLGGRGDYMTLLRVFGVGRVLGWLLIIPWLGKLVFSIWTLAIAVVAVGEVHGLDQFKSILCIVLPALALLFLTFIFVTLFVSLTTLSFLFGV